MADMQDDTTPTVGGSQVANRVIKFRAWDGKTMFRNESCKAQMMNPLNYETWSGNTLVWMQYTGLKDKNGVEIYEGDIFAAWERSKYAVEWIKKNACFQLVWVSGDVGDSKTRHHFDMLMAEYQFDKVGNIYENQELLK